MFRRTIKAPFNSGSSCVLFFIIQCLPYFNIFFFNLFIYSFKFLVLRVVAEMFMVWPRKNPKEFWCLIIWSDFGKWGGSRTFQHPLVRSKQCICTEKLLVDFIITERMSKSLTKVIQVTIELVKMKNYAYFGILFT